MRSDRPALTPWALMLVLAVIWGSSFILIKRGLYIEGEPVLNPWQLATGRLSIAWLCLAPALFRHAHLLRKHWLPLLGSGLLGNGIPAVLFATGQTRIDSSLSGMLNGLTPLMTLLAGAAFFGTRMRSVHLVGILLGLAGATGLILLKESDGLPAWSIYALLPILGAVCYGFSGNIVKHHLYGLPPMAISVLALTWVGPLSIVLALNSGLPEVLREHPQGLFAFGHVVVLAVMSSALALVLWNRLLKMTTALWASSVTYLMPLVAVGWGMADGEGFTWGMAGMAALVLAAIYLVNAGEKAEG
ncbi:MAG: DMT family transporter [Flavobacteriales bacterium]|nr:DMT family transporter [Flavobacteriales bacterium]